MTDGLSDYERMTMRGCHISKVTMKRSGVQFIIPRPRHLGETLRAFVTLSMGAMRISDGLVRVNG